eukprot:scaffold105796_cov17-Tisochrysis_lutea.AAC.3
MQQWMEPVPSRRGQARAGCLPTIQAGHLWKCACCAIVASALKSIKNQTTGNKSLCQPPTSSYLSLHLSHDALYQSTLRATCRLRGHHKWCADALVKASCFPHLASAFACTQSGVCSLRDGAPERYELHGPCFHSPLERLQGLLRPPQRKPPPGGGAVNHAGLPRGEAPPLHSPRARAGEGAGPPAGMRPHCGPAPAVRHGRCGFGSVHAKGLNFEQQQLAAGAATVVDACALRIVVECNL